MPKSKKTVCDLCSDSLGKGQDILSCEGGCNCTVHRYCAGVTTSHFQALTSPFVCQWCMLKTANAMIQQLQSEVASVKSELVEARAEVLKKDKENSTLVSSLKSELATVKDQLSRLSRPETASASYASAVTSGKPSNTHPRFPNNQSATTKREGQAQHRHINQNPRGGKTKLKLQVPGKSGVPSKHALIPQSQVLSQNCCLLGASSNLL